MIRLTLLCSTLLALGAIIPACPVRDRGPSERTRAIIGTSLPLEGPRLGAEGRLDLASLRGAVVLVDFWASWCAPCRDSMPFFADLVARYRGRGLAIVAVSVDDERELAERFMAERAMPFHVVWDGGHHNAERWPIENMPMSFIVDRDGLVWRVHRGFDARVAAEMVRDLETLLALDSGVR